MELKSLSKIFEKKLFRIPDYQRGYSWKEEHVRDFWQDLVNLGDDDKDHYTGLLTLKSILKSEFPNKSEEYWLLDEHAYDAYYVVDGQQRLTTFIILVQSIVETIKEIDENRFKKDDEIYLGTIKLSTILEQFLVKEKEPDRIVKTYILGYTLDDRSFKYLRCRILGEAVSGTIIETFYTLNLSNAKKYFKENLANLILSEGINGIQSIFKKLTQRFKFNEYIIQDDIDVFIAFETMNNRGKVLSKLELLKNRLIYLTTIYPDSEAPPDVKFTLRSNVNEAWKVVYYQLGRNKTNPLDDEEFLKAHWIIYFKFDQKRSSKYIKELLDDIFSPSKIYKKRGIDVKLEEAEEHRDDTSWEEEIDEDLSDGKTQFSANPQLEPSYIDKYVSSLSNTAIKWYDSFFPKSEEELSNEEKKWLDKLNRIGIGYFRPLVVSLLLTEKRECIVIKVLQELERFIFICFALNRSKAKSNYGRNLFYIAAWEIYHNKINTNELIKKIHEKMDWCFNPDGTFIAKYFKDYIDSKFQHWTKDGFRGWHRIGYFLYEYELELAESRGQQKFEWEPFIRYEEDRVSIEHIYPQTSNDECWTSTFGRFNDEEKLRLKGSLGNLLPLSASINSSLQNDCFKDKKKVKRDENGKIIRNGYKNGSHSETEVAELYEDWNSESILKRGLNLLNFMEERWKISLGGEREKIELLNLNFLI